MEKTVKKLLNYYLTQYPITEYLELFKNIIFDDILKAHENKLAEKDKEIESLKDDIVTYKLGNKLLKINYDELEKTQLYKEDFADYEITCQCKSEDCDFPGATIKYLKDSSKYDKLPSKDVK